MKKLFLYIVFALLTKVISAQSVFTPEQFIWFVKQYHPVVKQADLLKTQGENTIRRARGNFDPYLFTYFDNKQFDEKEYFRILNTGLKVPTWYGIELKTGFDQNRGIFVNPENNLPVGGLWYGGISVPIGQGLFIDNRRAQLKQAKIYAESTEAERKAILNDLYFEAIKHYWKWVEVYNQLKIYEESVELAQTRFEGVKQSFIFGDNPAIDTLEAYIQVQTRQMGKNQYELLYKNAKLELSNYLWFENNTPLEITDSLVPINYTSIPNVTTIPQDSITKILTQIEATHPLIQLYDYKLQSLEIERKLKTEMLKPKLNLNYNLLNEPIGSNYLSQLSPQNYKWGIEFSFPILLRQQRGELKLTGVKILDTEFNQQQKILEVKNEIQQYFNEQENLSKQITLFNSAVNNYQQLLEGEKQKFSLGESSLFLVNSREIGFIDAQVKLIELISKYEISKVGVIWASGEFYE
jgi:outer membrane protein TolC